MALQSNCVWLSALGMENVLQAFASVSQATTGLIVLREEQIHLKRQVI